MKLPRTTILMYHRVGVAPNIEEGDYVVPTALFEDQMRLLAAHHRPVVSLVDVAEGRYPDRSVALTFDDGCDTDATLVAPALLDLGSRPGRVRGPAGGAILPRLAVRRGHGLAGFEAALEPRPFVLLGAALRYALLRSARRVLGTRAYGSLRLRWLLRPAPPGRS